MDNTEMYTLYQTGDVADAVKVATWMTMPIEPGSDKPALQQHNMQASRTFIIDCIAVLSSLARSRRGAQRVQCWGPLYTISACMLTAHDYLKQFFLT
jgi:hypothetical protein